jgi:DNA-binding IclR family transcriptional regulator
MDTGDTKGLRDAAAEQTSPEGSERKYRAPALEKGLDVLELLAARGAPMTLSQISAALDRSVSELFRMVQALEFKGYIEASAGGEGYVLTNRLFALGLAQAPVKTLLESALPVMRRLSEASYQSCHIAVVSDDQIVVVARIEAPGDLGFSVRMGHRRPLVETTSGAVLYAHQPEELRKSWRERFAAHATSQRMDLFLQRVEEVKARGFGRADSDFVQGVVDISAPIVGAHRAVAALTVPFVQRMPPPCSQEETIALVCAAAKSISADIMTHD